MKILILFFLLIQPAIGAETMNQFKILPGKLHRGGNLNAEIASINDASGIMTVKFQYEIYKRPLVPVPTEYLKGSMVQDLPLKYADERGYLELEKNKTEDLPKAILTYMGRVKLGELNDVHWVKIKTKNGKSETEVFFHPTIQGLGWGKLQLTLHTSVPLVNNYQLEAKKL